MNFIEAVTELKEGRCKGIKRPSFEVLIVPILSRYGNNDGAQILAWQGEHSLYLRIEHFLATDWQLVDPVPQTEEVEVKPAYRCTNCDWLSTRKNDKCCNRPNNVLLTGTYTREVKPKVKRRELLGTAGVSGIVSVPDDAKLYAEWEE